MVEWQGDVGVVVGRLGTCRALGEVSIGLVGKS